MRRFFYILATLSLVGFAVSCDKGPTSEPDPVVTPPDPSPTLSLSKSSLEFQFDEIRVDKTVLMTTNADEFDVSVSYDDEDNAGWLDVASKAGSIGVAVMSLNIDLEELPRTATVTINAGGLSEEIKVTQLPYIETDFSIAMAAEQLDFAPSGNYLTKEIKTISKVPVTSAISDADWITSLEIVEKTVVVTVAENTGNDPREAVVTVGNYRDGSTTFKVYQYGKPSIDIAGNWNVVYYSAPNNNPGSWEPGNGLQIWRGDADIELIDGGYSITGIYGAGEIMTGLVEANPDLAPEIHLRLADDELYVGMDLGTAENGTPLDPAFVVGTDKYYFAKSLVYTDTETTIYTALDFPVTRLTEEREDGIYEVLVFPTQYSNNPEFPGETAEVIYIYYSYTYNPRTGMRYTRVDYLRTIVLERKIS